MQKATSKTTSINKTKLPAIYGKLAKLDGIGTIDYILDYGCGKYTDHITAWCDERGIKYLPYDKYNQDDTTNDTSLETALMAKIAGMRIIGVCSNVLNVIDDNGALQDVVNDLQFHTNMAFYTVYEGDKTGNGRYTGTDSYQRNLPLKGYTKYIRNAAIKNGMIIAR